jgi:hypothetical protein
VDSDREKAASYRGGSRKVAADSDQVVTMSIPEERGPDAHHTKVDVSVPAGSP